MADNSPVRKLSARMVLETSQWEDGVEKVKKKTLNLSTTTSQSLESVKNAYSKTAKSVDVTTNALDDLEAEARRTRKEIQQSERQYQRFKDEMEKANMMVGKTATEQQILNAQMRLGKGATQQQKDEVARLITEYNKLNGSTGKTRHGFRAMRNSFSQIQYQMQDIAVQMQSNTSPFIILSQQGSQIASLFGPYGAVVGSLLAFSGMIGGTVFGALMNGKSAADELADAIERVDRFASDKQGLVEYTDLIQRVAKTSTEAAKALLQQAILDQNNAITKAMDNVIDKFEEIGGSGALSWRVLNNDTRTGRRYIQEAQEEAAELVKRVKEIGAKPTTEGIKALRDEVLSFGDNGKFANKETQEWVTTLITMLDEVDRGILKLDDFKKKLNEGVDVDFTNTGLSAEDIESEIAALEAKARMVDEGILFKEKIGYEELNAAQQKRVDLALYEIQRLKELKAEEEELARIRAEEKKLTDKGSQYLYELQSQADVLNGLPARNEQWLESLREVNEALYDQIMALRESNALKIAGAQAEQVAISAKQQMANTTRQSFATLAQVSEEGSELQKAALLSEQMSAAASIWFSSAAASLKIDEKYAGIQGGPALAATEKAALEANKWTQLGAIAAQTVAGVFHDGGGIPDDGTYLMQGGEYVESQAERRDIDSIVKKVDALYKGQGGQGGQGPRIKVVQHIATVDQLDLNQVMARSHEGVYNAVKMAERKRGIKS